MAKRKLNENELLFLYENIDAIRACVLQKKLKEKNINISYPTLYRFVKGIGHWKDMKKTMKQKKFEEIWKIYSKSKDKKIQNKKIQNKKIQNKKIQKKEIQKKRMRKTRIEVLKSLAHSIKIDEIGGRFGVQFKNTVPKNLQSEFIKIVKEYSYQIFPNNKKEIQLTILDKKTLSVINFLAMYFDLPEQEIKRLIIQALR